jgi:hypothetical protein
LADNGQAQAGAGNGAGGVEAVEAAEDAFVFGFGDGGCLVGDADLGDAVGEAVGGAVGGADPDVHGLFGWAELHGVVEEVDDGAFEGGGSSVDGDGLGVQVEAGVRLSHDDRREP